MVGGEVFVDQHLDTTGDMTTLADDTFSFHKLQIDDGSHSSPGNIQLTHFEFALTSKARSTPEISGSRKLIEICFSQD